MQQQDGDCLTRREPPSLRKEEEKQTQGSTRLETTDPMMNSQHHANSHQHVQDLSSERTLLLSVLVNNNNHSNMLSQSLSPNVQQTAPLEQSFTPPSNNHTVISETRPSIQKLSQKTQKNPSNDTTIMNQPLSLGLVLTFAIYSFFHMVNPQQPFLVEFLTSKGISLKTILFDIFPIWSYSMPFVQLCIGIISELKFIGHKWVIVVGILASVLFMLSEFFSTKNTVWMLQVTEIAVAVLYGTDQTYLALLYHSSSPNSYQFLTSLSRACILMGQVLGAVVGQIVYMCGVSIQVLYYMGFACIVPCLYLAIFHFPSPKKYVRSIHTFETNDNACKDSNATSKEEDPKLASSKADIVESVNYDQQSEVQLSQQIHEEEGNTNIHHEAMTTAPSQQDSIHSRSGPIIKFHKLISFLKNSKIWKFVVDVKKCYTENFSVPFWSIYCIVGIAVHMLALTYYQTFFKTLNNQISLNGILIAVAYACASMIAMIPTRLGNWVSSWKGKMMAAIVCLACGSCLIAISVSRKCPVFVAYLLFVVYHCLFEFLYVVSFTQIAKGLKLTRFAAIFSFNSALANVFQLLIQVLVGKQILALGPMAQFTAFGIIMVALSIFLFFCTLGYGLFNRRTRQIMVEVCRLNGEFVNHALRRTRNNHLLDTI